MARVECTVVSLLPLGGFCARLQEVREILLGFTWVGSCEGFRVLDKGSGVQVPSDIVAASTGNHERGPCLIACSAHIATKRAQS